MTHHNNLDARARVWGPCHSVATRAASVICRWLAKWPKPGAGSLGTAKSAKGFAALLCHGLLCHGSCTSCGPHAGQSNRSMRSSLDNPFGQSVWTQGGYLYRWDSWWPTLSW